MVPVKGGGVPLFFSFFGHWNCPVLLQLLFTERPDRRMEMAFDVVCWLVTQRGTSVTGEAIILHAVMTVGRWNQFLHNFDLNRSDNCPAIFLWSIIMYVCCGARSLRPIDWIDYACTECTQAVMPSSLPGILGSKVREIRGLNSPRNYARYPSSQWGWY